MDDISREQEWQPSLRSAEQDPPGPSREGTKKRYVSEFMGRELRNTYVVTEAVEEYLKRASVRPAFRSAMDEVLEDHAELLDRLAR